MSPLVLPDSTTSSSNELTHLLIDTDPGVDDVLAIILALAQPHVRVVAITSTFGNTTIDHAHDNISRLVTLLKNHIEHADTSEAFRKRYEHSMGKQAEVIEIARGTDRPVEGKLHTAAYFHGFDGLSGASLSPAYPCSPTPHPLQQSSEAAHDVILAHLRRTPKLRIAALGPLTNLALAYAKDPTAFAQASISIMGGALDEPGNTTATGEFNFVADPVAARQLLIDSVVRGKLNVQLLPLDVTSWHTVPYARLCSGKGPLGEFMATVLAKPRIVTNSLVPSSRSFDAALDDNFQAHDPLAIAHACFAPFVGVSGPPAGSKAFGAASLNGASAQKGMGWKVQKRAFGIETHGVLTRGMCVVDRRPGEKAGTHKAEDEDEEHPEAKSEAANGAMEKEAAVPREAEIDVVVDSPGVDWFEKVFCEALDV